MWNYPRNMDGTARRDDDQLLRKAERGESPSEIQDKGELR